MMQRLGLLVLGTLLCSLSSPVARGQAFSQAFIPTTTASRYGMESAWVTRAQLDITQGRLQNIVLGSGLLVAQTDRGTIQAIDAETGRTFWVVRVGRPEFPTSAPAADDKVVVVANGSTMYCLDRANGRVLWSSSLSNAAAGGCAVGGGYAYVALQRGAIEQFKTRQVEYLDRYGRLLHGTGDVDAPPLVTEKGIYWGTGKGYLFSFLEKQPIDQFRFRTGGPIRTTPAYRSPLVYIGSEDGYVYALDEMRGNLVWQYSIGGRIVRPLLAAAHSVYVAPEFGGLYSLDAATGERNWYSPGIFSVLASLGDRLYATDLIGQIVVIDVATGSRLGTLPAAMFDIKLTNPHNGNLYLANQMGLVQCLRPRGAAPPVRPTTTPLESEPSTPSPFGTPEPSAPDNPFGSPAPGNPFGAPPATPNPFDGS